MVQGCVAPSWCRARLSAGRPTTKAVQARQLSLLSLTTTIRGPTTSEHFGGHRGHRYGTHSVGCKGSARVSAPSDAPHADQRRFRCLKEVTYGVRISTCRRPAASVVELSMPAIEDGCRLTRDPVCGLVLVMPPQTARMQLQDGGTDDCTISPIRSRTTSPIW